VQVYVDSHKIVTLPLGHGLLPRNFHGTMKRKHFLTYKELKTQLALKLERKNIPTSTLSRWMKHLCYEKGQPGKKREWEEEDLFALYCFGSSMSWGWTAKEGVDYTERQIENWRKLQNGTEHRQDQTTTTAA